MLYMGLPRCLRRGRSLSVYRRIRIFIPVCERRSGHMWCLVMAEKIVHSFTWESGTDPFFTMQRLLSEFLGLAIVSGWTMSRRPDATVVGGRRDVLGPIHKNNTFIR